MVSCVGGVLLLVAHSAYFSNAFFSVGLGLGTAFLIEILGWVLTLGDQPLQDPGRDT